jgi:hypothetical protein
MGRSSHARSPEDRLHRRKAINRFPKAVEHSTEQIRANRNFQWVPHRDDLGTRTDAMSFAQWHQENPSLAETHHLGEGFTILLASDDPTQLAHGTERPLTLDDQSNELHHPAPILDHAGSPHPLQDASQTLPRRCLRVAHDSID